jgi:hypothetical protein
MKTLLFAALMTLLVGGEAHAADVTWVCDATIVSADLEYTHSSMDGGLDEIITFHFERPPSGKFTFKVHQDSEGPLYWGAELNGKDCKRVEPANSLTSRDKCLDAVRAIHREAEKRTKLIPFTHVPRVLPSEGDCQEEELKKTQINIDWVKTCLKNIKYYAKNRKEPGPCWRDKKYFCAVDPGSDTCENFPANWRRNRPARENYEE